MIGRGDLLRPLGRKQRHLRRRAAPAARRRARAARSAARGGWKSNASWPPCSDASARRTARSDAPRSSSARGTCLMTCRSRTSTVRRRAGPAPTSPDTAGDRRAAAGTCRAGRAPRSTCDAQRLQIRQAGLAAEIVFRQHARTCGGNVERSAAGTTMVVRGVRLAENTPPSRSTSVRVSRFDSRLSRPTSATCWPANGRSAGRGTSRT